MPVDVAAAQVEDATVTAEPAGLVRAGKTVAESPAVTPAKVLVIVIVIGTLIPTFTVEAEAVELSEPGAVNVTTFVPPVKAALAGTTESSPIPSADTATSAMRLIVVFVDINHSFHRMFVR